MAKVGLPRIPLHDLRHGLATMALVAGVPAKIVQERLGHANISVTMDIYIHVIDQLDEKAAAQVAAMVLPVSNPFAGRQKGWRHMPLG